MRDVICSSVCLLLLTGVLISPSLSAQEAVILPSQPTLDLSAGETYGLLDELPPDVIDPGLIDDIGTEIEPTDATNPEKSLFGFFEYRTRLREKMREYGISRRRNITMFYQGVASGGEGQEFVFGPKLDNFVVIEMEKLLGLKGTIINLHSENRFGESVNAFDGSLLPANFSLQFPKDSGQASALSNMQIQQFLSENFVVSFGKLNTADGMNVHPFMGGYGTDRFMNTAFIVNPAFGRAIPYSTLGVSFSYLLNNDPVATLMVVDPTGRPDTAGFSQMLSNGVSLFGQLRLPVNIADLPGHQTLEGSWSSGKFNPLISDDYVILPDPGSPGRRETGTWAFNYGFDQFIVHDDETPGKGWGVFGNFTVADQQTNPLGWFMNVGVAGSRLIPIRPDDSFGLAYFCMGLSSDLRRTGLQTLPGGTEQGFEAYYAAAITRWFQLTFDIQAMDTASSGVDPALLFGLRGKLTF